MYDLLKKFGNEEAIKRAFDENPAKMRQIIEEDIAYYSTLTDRDYVSREYVSILRRILGISGADLHADHQARMEKSLKDAGVTKESILANLTAKREGDGGNR